MKKKHVIIIIVILLLISGIVFIKFFPLGNSKYYIEQEKYLNIPKLSFLEKTDKENKIVFKTFQSEGAIIDDFDKSIKNYKKKTCHLKEYYYDKENDIMILEYGVLKDSSLFTNKFYIKYDIGNYSNDICNEITDYKTVQYSYYHIPSNSPYPRDMKKMYQYLDLDDNQKYDVYSDCDGCLQLKKGTGYDGLFEDLLRASYISMNTFIKFLDYQVEENKATKTNYENGVIYKTSEFSLLKCTNKKVYISDILEYKKEYCS